MTDNISPRYGLLNPPPAMPSATRGLLGALMGIPSAFANMAQQGLLAHDNFLNGRGDNGEDLYARPFLPNADNGGRLGAMASFLNSNMAFGGPAGSLGAGPNVFRGFHSSPNNFEKFELARAGTTTDSGKLGRAVYFGTDPRVAERGPHRYEAEIKSANPLELELPNFKTDKADVVRRALGLPEDASSDAVSAAARARGHDAIVMDYSPTGYAHKEVAALDDGIISILKKYGLAGLLVGGGAMGAQE